MATLTPPLEFSTPENRYFKVLFNLDEFSGNSPMLLLEKMLPFMEEYPHLKSLLLDMSVVTFISSSGIGALAEVSKRLSAREGQVFVVVKTPKLKYLLQLMGIQKIMMIFDSTETAITAIS